MIEMDDNDDDDNDVHNNNNRVRVNWQFPLFYSLRY